jgi:DNA-binding CsgD family transcriptional regulator
MGLYLAWTVGNNIVRKAIGIRQIPSADFAQMVCNMGASIVVLIVVLLCSRRIKTLLSRSRLQALAVLSLTGGTALMLAVLPLNAIGAGQFAALSVVCVGSLFRGLGSAFFFLMWNEVYARMPLKRVSLWYSGSYLLSVILHALLTYLPSIVAAWIVVALPLGSYGLFRQALKEPEVEAHDENPEAREWTFPVRPLVLIGLVTFVVFFCHHAVGDSSSAADWVGGGLVAAVSLVLCLAWKNFSADQLEHVCVPLMVAGLLVWSVGGEGLSWAVVALTDAGNIAFRIFVLVMACSICYRFKVPALWMFSIVRLVMLFSEMLALGFGLWRDMSYGPLDVSEVQVICAVLIFVLVVVASVSSHNPFIAGHSWAVLPKKAKGETRDEQLLSVMSKNELMVWKCAKVARAHGLTHREEEVLSCLANDMTNAQIQEALFISVGTCNTHMRHIYEKLDVHSRKEAIDLVNSAV